MTSATAASPIDATRHRLGIVVGLVAEARIAVGIGAIGNGLGAIGIGGGSPQGAHDAAEHLVATGATALLSFGLAGGLDPTLRPGQPIVPAAILHNRRSYPADPSLLQRLGGPNAALLAAEAAPIASAAAKSALFRATAAAAVDLESGAVAEVAARHHIPFAALRIICDPADRDLPPAAIVALSPTGAIMPGRVLASLLRHPGQLPALLRLAADARIARGALRAAANTLRVHDV